ncbi:MAG: SMEK domain-containing protein [Lachnospiraceae bacterium]|nr:SMEK domain-containing protein [Lachnospiraceae bacterium]
MTTRTFLLGELNRLFSVLETMLGNGGRMGLLDDHLCCEDIMCKVLNDIYGWELVNLNRQKKNYPGIDLGDEHIGLGVQISADKSSGKITETLEKVIRHRVYETFPSIKVLILGRKQKSYSISREVGLEKTEFVAERDILDLGDLLEQCQNMETERLQKVCEGLRYELGLPEKNASPYPPKTREKIREYMSFLEKESEYITILGLGEKLPMEQVWIQLSLMNVKDMDAGLPDGQWSFLQQYNEYKISHRNAYDMEAVLADRENAVILAGPGMGKSTLCKKLFMEFRKERKTVVKVRLFDVARYMRDGNSFVEAVCLAASEAVSFHLEKEELDREFDVLILDGLDECSDLQHEVAKGITVWGIGHEAVRIIVTSRPIGYCAAEFEGYRHFQIVPLEDEELEHAAITLLRVIKEDYEEDFQWFQQQMKSRSARELACRSPLLLGFLVQLSLGRRNLGQYKVGLYKDIMQVWLEGSSRHNEKKRKDVELQEGIEAIAYYLMSSIEGKTQSAYFKESIVSYVGAFFQTELGVGRLQASGVAEDCLEFWTQRGILERNYISGRESYLFLHLNVGEYLAASHLAKKSVQERCGWIRENYRKNIWHETIRMLVACDTEGHALEELLRLGRQEKLPDVAVFLAAEGVAERETEECPQELYDRLLFYVQGDNPYLAEKAAEAAAKLRGKEIDWHVETLLTLWRSGQSWSKNAAYHIYLSVPQEQQDYEVIREYVLYYSDERDHRTRWKYSRDLENTILFLREDAQDAPVVEALKGIYYHHCSVYEMQQLDTYFERLGLGNWTKEFMEKVRSEMPPYDFGEIHKKLDGAEARLVQILAELYGSESTEEDLQVCVEYSKLTEAVELMQRPVSELFLLERDLEKSCAASLLRAACAAAEVDTKKIRKEIFVMQTMPADSVISISGQRRVKVLKSPCWEKTRGMVSKEDIVEGLCSVSSIMGDLAMQVAYENWEMEGLRSEVVALFEGNKPSCIYRAGILLLAEDVKTASDFLLQRMLKGDGAILPELLQLLGICNCQLDNWQMWLEALNRCLEYGREAVRAVALYLQGDVLRQVPKEALHQLLPVVKHTLQEWENKKLKCRRCKEHPYLEPDGFCPICHTGGELPNVNLLKALLKWEQVSMDELAGYMKHPLYDMNKAAREGMFSLLEKHPEQVGKALEKVERGFYPKDVFEVILKLAPEITGSHEKTLLRLADGSCPERTKAFLKQLNNQKWISPADRRAYVERMLRHENEEIRSEAMAAWLK